MNQEITQFGYKEVQYIVISNPIKVQVNPWIEPPFQAWFKIEKKVQNENETAHELMTRGKN